jgi:hypothetical protein
LGYCGKIPSRLIPRSVAHTPVYECRATHAAGVRSGRHRIGRSAIPGRIAEKWLHTGTFSLRQLSTTDRIAATFGPASGQPMCIQFLRVSKYFDTRNQSANRGGAKTYDNHCRHTIRFDLWVAFLSALVFSIKVHSA